MKNKKILFLFLIFSLLISSCKQISAPVTSELDASIKEVVSAIPYKSVINLGYMGGSLPFTPDSISECPLRRGATIAVRLGTVTRNDIDAGTEYEQSVFDDVPDKARYGLLKIVFIDESKISFTLQLYSENKEDLASKVSYTLYEGNEIDINNDTLPDLKYYQPADQRAGYNNARYLTFISDQEKLNTTMFSVIADQYQNNDYPGGIIGINPNGNMILSKYNSSGSRSVLSTFRNGDYVLDTVEGKYQKIVSSNFTGTSRAVQDSELQDMVENISYLFTPEEFVGRYDAKLLLNSIKDMLKVSTPATAETVTGNVDGLNVLIKKPSLVADLKAQNVFVENAIEVDNIIAELANPHTEEEVTQINRSLLETLFPDVCPKLVVASNVYTEILPLANVTFGTGDDKQPANRSARAGMTESQYNAEKRKLEDRYNRDYKRIMGLKVPSIDLASQGDEDKGEIDGTSFAFDMSGTYFSVGINGSFTASWGSVKASVKAAVFVTAHSDLKAAKLNIEKTLAKRQLDKRKFKMNLGPILVKLEYKSALRVPLEVNFYNDKHTDYRVGFTGLYEAGFGAAMDYGIKWKGWWFVKVPVPYFDFSSNSWSDSETIAYAKVGEGTGYLPMNSGNFKISANFDNQLSLSLCNVVEGSISGTFGVGANFTIKPKRWGGVTGTMALVPNLSVGAGVFVGIVDVPILGSIGKQWEFDIWEPDSKPIWETTLF